MDDRQMIREQRIVIGRSTDRQVISGIMQREMSIPGTIVFTADTTAVNTSRIRILLSSFTIKEKIPETAMMQDRTATVMFALWQFM
jgi:hypothetical protein